jgi:hypothetical protein
MSNLLSTLQLAYSFFSLPDGDHKEYRYMNENKEWIDFSEEELLKKNEDGIYYSEEHGKLFKVETRFDTKFAKTDEDFENIYFRELKAGSLQESFYQTRLLEKVTKMYDEIAELSNNKYNNDETLQMIHNFKSWVNQKIQINNTPALEYSTIEFDSINKKIAWMHELGILQKVLSYCMDGNTFNYGRQVK